MTYRDLFKFKSGRLMMTLLIAAATHSMLMADNKIIVEDFTIVNGRTAVVSVKLENDPNVIAMGTKVTLPEGMSIVPQHDAYQDEDVNFLLNTGRTYDPTQLYGDQVVTPHFILDNQKGNSFTIAIGHDELMPFIGNSGEELFRFVVKASNRLSDESQLLFSGIHFDLKDGTNLSEVEQDNFSVKVTKEGAPDPEEAVQDALNKVAEESAKVEALKISDEAKNYENAAVKEAVDKGEAAIAKATTAVEALSSLVNGAIADGTIVDDAVQTAIDAAVAAADAAIADAEAAIAAAEKKYQDVLAQYEAQKPIRDAKQAEIDNLQQTLEAALKAIGDMSYVDVADYQTAIDAVQAQIGPLQGALDDAFQNLELTDAFAVDPDGTIAKQIADLSAEAQAEQTAEESALADNNNHVKKLEADMKTAIDKADEAGVSEKVAGEKQVAEDAIAAFKQFIADNEGNLTKDAVREECTRLGAAADAAVEALDRKIEESHDDGVVSGDINGNGEVDDEDVDAFIELYLDDEVPEEGDANFKCFDANGDGIISLADAVAIFYLSNGLNYDGTDPNASRVERQQPEGSVTVETTDLGNGIVSYVLNLKGNFAYAGFALDVKGGRVVKEQAEGMTLRSVDTKGKHRIVAYNFGQAAAAGTVLTIDVMGDAEFSDINFSDAYAQSISFHLGETTGIGATPMDNGQWTMDNCYDLNGRVSKSQKKGVNILRNGNGKAKKVSVK